MEAVDCGAKLLLIDEDRSATNFMIRDRMMKDLIKKNRSRPLRSSYFTNCERFLDLPRKQELLFAINRMRLIDLRKDFT